MNTERLFYAIILAIVVVGGISVGAAYYGSTTSQPASTTPVSTSLTLVIVPSGWYSNSTIHHDQPAFLVLEPNGTLVSSAYIHLPAHQLITLKIIDYDSYGLTPVIGINGTANQSEYAKFTGTVGNMGYVYNSTNVNVTLPPSSTGNVSIPGGLQVSSFPWQGNSSGGYDVAHTFTILSGSNIVVNAPSPGMSVVTTQFYLNNTGTYVWQCFVPCGYELDGWGGAMATSGWMTGTIDVS
ncbi:MAG: hypothetical protein M1533_00980 [Candidatus Thermoplasmatota archaeon]|nr:hypothetical protein [Candidatus Thermoplasmatota archaeon]MCL5794599.1 hypothetical protein [Candidatus Thermoplasmatota archaeon]